MMKIVLIDNQDYILEPFNQLLALHHLEQIVFRSLEDGLTYIYNRSHDVQCLILCEKYGKTDGVEVLKQIRDVTYPPYTIVVIDEDTHYEKKVALMLAGASDLFDRSWHIIELMLKIQKSNDERVLRDNLNRELTFSLDSKLGKYVEVMKKKLEQDDLEFEALLPSEMKDIFSKYFNDSLAQRRPRILCVEDEEDMQKLIKLALSEEFDVDTASTGQKAENLIMANRGEYDLVLLDIAMPGKTGERWVSDFLNIDPNLCICMLTGFTDDIKVIVDSIRRGARDYIAKPFMPRHLVKLVCKHIKYKLLQDHILKAWNSERLRYQTERTIDNS